MRRAAAGTALDADAAAHRRRPAVLPALRAAAARVHPRHAGAKGDAGSGRRSSNRSRLFPARDPLQARHPRRPILRKAAGKSCSPTATCWRPLLLILLSNALDAIPDGGEIRVRCRPLGAGTVGFAVQRRWLRHQLRPISSTCSNPSSRPRSPARAPAWAWPSRTMSSLEHGGSIRIESEPGQSATTAYRRSAAAAAGGAQGSRYEDRGEPRGARILVVDDDAASPPR